ncbi:MAG: c-type cytochrome [Bacteriovoracaceae bacterium]|nr:c-type cytochrome [Bacteriovoracaceae bacterium]
MWTVANISNFVLSVSAVLMLASCNYKIEKKQLENIGPISQELRQSVSYNQVKSEVFRDKCISCHGNSGGVNLESYGAAFQHLEAIKKTVLKTKTMPKPPFSGLNKRQLEILAAWIEAGGPEKPLGGGPVEPDPDPVPIEPTYSSIKKNVLELKCISCHKTGEQAGRIPLVTKEDLLNSPYDLVVPGDPDESGIMIVLEPGARKFMPPKDSGISPITEEEKNAIKVWIQNGAP